MRGETSGATWDPHRNPMAALPGQDGMDGQARLSAPTLPSVPLGTAAEEAAVDTDTDTLAPMTPLAHRPSDGRVALRVVR